MSNTAIERMFDCAWALELRTARTENVPGNLHVASGGDCHMYTPSVKHEVEVTVLFRKFLPLS